MSTCAAGSGLRIDVARWSSCLMPKNEIEGALTFLAHKTGKSVRFGPYRGSVQYAAELVNVYVCTTENFCRHPLAIKQVTLSGQVHELHSRQTTFGSVADLPGTVIEDEEHHGLARVDRNCVVLLIDITAQNNTAGRAILAYVVERAIPLLDFKVEDRIKEQRELILRSYDAFHKAAIRSRVDDKQTEVQRLERDAENFFYQLVSAERELPMARKELEALEKQIEEQSNPLAEKQADGLAALIQSGQYEEITPAHDGCLFARTSGILVEHDDWTFDLGRYEINIDAQGKVSIYSADGTDADGYPHPHVDSSGRPCLGNISADLARSIGRMRIAEALTLLHDFLSSYNEDGPYIRIGRFDPNYEDPDDQPCDDCEDYHTPYCINECSHNDGNYCCSDCSEYRTDYCYQECGYNQPGFILISPCDACEEGEAHCFLECPYNDRWQQNSPCTGCDKTGCEECEYAEKKKLLEARDAPASHPAT